MEPTKVFDGSDSGNEKTIRSSTVPDGSSKLPVVEGFTIFAELGRGGMGVVYEALEEKLNRKVALKVMSAAAKLSDKEVRRFENEAHAAAALSHDHIVPLYQIGVSGDLHYYTMQLIDGDNLSQLVKNAKRQTRDSNPAKRSTVHDTQTHGDTKRSGANHPTIEHGLDGHHYSKSIHRSSSRSAKTIAKSVARVGEQVGKAIHHAHENGVVHRDIKPSNLILDRSDKVWVADFGLARLQHSGGAITKSGDIIGTLKYMSPEQASGRRAFVDHRSDIYSLGVTLYELATLRSACRGSTVEEILRELTFERPVPIRRLNPRLPAELETIISKATERNPSDRYQTALELADDLERFLKGEKPNAKRTTAVKRSWQWLAERPTVAALMGCLFAALLAASVLFGVFQRANYVQEQEARKVAEGGRLQAKSRNQLEENPAVAVELARNGALLAPGLEANVALMDALDANHELHRVEIGPTDGGIVRISPDGRIAAVCDSPFRFFRSCKKAIVFDVSNGKKLFELESDSAITHLEFSPDSRRLLTGGNSTPTKDRKYASVILWDLGNGEQLHKFSGARFRNSTSRAFLGNERVVLLDEQNTAVVYDKEWRSVGRLGSSDQEVLDVAASPDAQRVGQLLQNGVIEVFDSELNLQQSFESAPRGLHRRMQFSKDADRLLCQSNLGSHLYRLSGKETKATYFESSLVRMSRDGKRLFVFTGALGKYEIRVEDLQNSRLLSSIELSSPISLMEVSQENEFVAVGDDREIWLFDTNSGEQIAALRGHDRFVRSFAITANQKSVVSSSSDGTARIWSVSSNRASRTLDARLQNRAACMALDSKGKRLAVGTIRGYETLLFDQALGSRSPRIGGELQATTQDGRLVVSVEGRVEIWSKNGERRIAQKQLSWERIGYVTEGTPSKLLIGSIQGEWIAWDSESDTLSYVTERSERARQLLVSQDKSTTLLRLDDGKCYLLDLVNNDRKLIATLDEAITDLALSEDGEQAAVLTSLGEVVRLNVANGAELARNSIANGSYSRISWIDSEKLLLWGREQAESTAAVWSVDDQEVNQSQKFQGASSFRFSPDRTSICAFGNGGAQLWDYSSNAPRPITPRRCLQVAYVDEDLFLVVDSGTSEGEAVQQLLRYSSESESIAEDATDLNFRVRRSIVSDEEGKLALSGWTYGAILVEQDGLRVSNSFVGNQGTLKCLSFRNSDQELVAVDEKGVVCLYEEDGRLATRMFVGETEAALVTADKRFVVAANAGELSLVDLEDKVVRVVEVNGAVLKQLRADQQSKSVLGFNNDSLWLWDIRSEVAKEIKLEGKIRDVAVDEAGENFVVLFLPAAEEGANIHAIHVELKADVRTEIALDDYAPQAVFLGDERFAILGADGQVTVHDFSGAGAANLIPYRNEVMSLMGVEEDTFYAAVENGIVGWDWKTGEQKVELNQLNLDQRAGKLFVNEWAVTNEASSHYFGYSYPSFVSEPKDVLDYAAKNSLRRLTSAERAAYRIPDFAQNLESKLSPEDSK